MEPSLAGVLSTTAALASFSFATSITPGPNNIMLMMSGAHHGFRATVPHMLGVASGMAGLLALAYFGIAALAADQPGLQAAMTWVCALYMVWLASKLLRDRAPENPSSAAQITQPLSVMQAATFQLVNPKGWAMALTAATTVLAADLAWASGISLLLGVFTVVNLPCLAVWTLWGAMLRRFLARPRLKLAFDVFMALLLLATAVAMIRGVDAV